MMHSAVETWPAEAGAPEPPGGPLYFDAVLSPNRSLPSAGFSILMATLIAVSFTCGVVFVLIGAWPVPVFFGVDVLLVWLAFRSSYRAGRAREIIRVGPDRILVHRRHASGAVRHYQMPTGWTKAALAHPGEHAAQFSLVAHGKALVLGGFLSPPERESLADAVSRALARARQGGYAQEAGGDGG